MLDTTKDQNKRIFDYSETYINLVNVLYSKETPLGKEIILINKHTGTPQQFIICNQHRRYLSQLQTLLNNGYRYARINELENITTPST